MTLTRQKWLGHITAIDTVRGPQLRKPWCKRSAKRKN